MTELRHIASTACLALAEIADDPTGRTAETLMTGWMGDGKTAGEAAADAVVAEVKALRVALATAEQDRASIVAYIRRESESFMVAAARDRNLPDAWVSYTGRSMAFDRLAAQVARGEDRK